MLGTYDLSSTETSVLKTPRCVNAVSLGFVTSASEENNGWAEKQISEKLLSTPTNSDDGLLRSSIKSYIEGTYLPLSAIQTHKKG